MIERIVRNIKFKPKSKSKSMATDTITCEQVIAKFEELREKYYLDKGYMITTIPDSIAATIIEKIPDSTWVQSYNYLVSEKVPILCATVEVELFDRKFVVRFDRPCQRDYHSEFEHYFGFGGHCLGYTDKRIIACFPRTHTSSNVLNVTELLTAPADEIDDEYAKRALALLVMGGYVKYWDAYYEFSKWFTSFGTFQGADVKIKDVILPYITDYKL